MGYHAYAVYAMPDLDLGSESGKGTFPPPD